MMQDKDQGMRELMDTAVLQELVPGFDKEAVWQRISVAAHRPEKKIISGRWWSHAAALAAGILLAWVFFHGQPRRGTPLQSPTLAKVVVPLPAELPSLAVSRQPAVALARQERQRKKPSPEVSGPVPVPPAPAPVPVVEAPPPLAACGSASAHAVHLLDLGKEDREILLCPAPVALGAPSLSDRIRKHPYRMQEYARSAGSAPMVQTLFRNLIHNKNED